MTTTRQFQQECPHTFTYITRNGARRCVVCDVHVIDFDAVYEPVEGRPGVFREVDPADVIDEPEDDDVDSEPVLYEGGPTIQSLIDSGDAWRLEGSVGRFAMQCIEEGLCTLGPTGHRDYFGNYVPSRDEVEPGTLGSVEYAERVRAE